MEASRSSSQTCESKEDGVCEGAQAHEHVRLNSLQASSMEFRAGSLESKILLCAGSATTTHTHVNMS